jgi:hypothetical protein
MRRIITAILSLLAAAAALAGFLDAAATQGEAWLQAPADSGVSISIPADPRLANPDAIYRILKTAAGAAHANVFRVSTGYDADDRPQITLYALLTAPTDVSGAYRISEGRWLEPSDELHPERFLSSLQTGSPNQIGRLTDLGGGDTVSVRSLQSAFESLPVAGSYTVEAPDPSSADQFLDLLAAGASTEAGAPGAFSRSTFVGGTSASGGAGSDVRPILSAAQLVIIGATALLIAFYVLRRAKAIAVMRLQGLDPVAVWYRLIGKWIAGVGLVAIAVIALASWLVPGATLEFGAALVLSVLRAFAVMLLASVGASSALLVVSASDSIKNHKPTGLLLVLNVLLKVGLTLILIGTWAGLWVQYANSTYQRTLLAGWDRARGYAIFYPVTVGNDLTDVANGQPAYTPAEVYDLYPLLDRQGALFVDASAWESVALTQPLSPGGYRFMTINNNYLHQFPIVDDSGLPIEVPDTTVDWVVLVPSRMRAEAGQVEAFFQRARASTRQAEHAVLGRTVPDVVASQRVSIRWIADGQRLFSFDPDVYPAAGNTVMDPIVAVMTTSNSTGLDRANAITGGPGAALKVFLGNTGTAQMLDMLKPTLQRLRLDDNLRQLVTMNDYANLEIRRLDDAIRDITIAASAVFLVLLYLVVGLAGILVERHARKIAVRRLMGVGFARRYREPLRLFGAMWLAQLGGALIANRLGFSLFSSTSNPLVVDDRLIVAIAAVVAVAEGAVCVWAFLRTERRNMARVLKEEF